MADRIRNLQNKLKSKMQNKSDLSVLITYFPVIGWILASLMQSKKDTFTRFHIQQSKEINLALIVIYLFVWFLENFPLTNWLFGKDRILYPLAETVWILFFFAYMGITIILFYKVLNDEIWSFPYRENIKKELKKLWK